MEPTSAMMENMQTVQAVCEHLELDSSTEAVKGLLSDIGAEVTTKPISLAMITKDEAEEVLKKEGINLVIKSKFRQLFHICRMIGGVVASQGVVEKMMKEITDLKCASLPQLCTAEENKIKLSMILSQTKDTEVTVMGVAEVVIAYTRYEAVYGAGSAPLPMPSPPSSSCPA